jgi:hypothetical protein
MSEENEAEDNSNDYKAMSPFLFMIVFFHNYLFIQGMATQRFFLLGTTRTHSAGQRQSPPSTQIFSPLPNGYFVVAPLKKIIKERLLESREILIKITI